MNPSIKTSSGGSTAWGLRLAEGLTALIIPLVLTAAAGGSTRATLVWSGLLGYLLYTYLGVAIAYSLSPFVLIYIAIFSLTTFALLAVLGNLNGAQVKAKFDGATKARA